MGHCKLNFSEGYDLENEGIQTKWIKLLGTTSGEVLVKIKWNGYSSIKVPQKLPEFNIKPLKKTPAAMSEKIVTKLLPKRITPTPNKKSGLLILIIKSADGLEAGDTDGFSDPFVKIWLNTASKKQKKQTFKTSVKKQTLTP